MAIHRSMPSRFSRGGIIAIALVLGVGPAQAQDYMGMAELYGQGVVNSLGTQIRNEGIRQSSRQGAPATPSATTRWPSHISETSVADHVFTVDELAAMRSADGERQRRMLEGRVITVRGVVKRLPRATKGFNVAGLSQQGYHVWASWSSPPAFPADGAVIVLRGKVETQRRTNLSISNPQIVSAGAATAQTAEAPLTSPPTNQKPDYDALRFQPSQQTTALVAERMADTLAPALAPGRDKSEIVALVKGGRLQTTFRDLLRPFGFSDRDLGDVLASHLVMSWQIANDHPEDGPRAGVMEVRRQTRETLARSDWLRDMTDAQKQQLAETLSVGTMMLAARYFDAREAGDRAAVSTAMKDARDMGRSFGNVDLTRFDFTSRGFEPRR